MQESERTFNQDSEGQTYPDMIANDDRERAQGGRN